MINRGWICYSLYYKTYVKGSGLRYSSSMISIEERLLLLFCFASFFVSMLSLKPRPFVQLIVLRYAGVPIVNSPTCFFFCFFFFVVYLEMSLFPSIFLYHFRLSLFVWRVRRTFFPSGWCLFYLVTTGWIFDISLCENSINQSIRFTREPRGRIRTIPGVSALRRVISAMAHGQHPRG